MLNRAVFAAIAGYIVFLPTTGAISDLSWHDDQRLSQIALLLATAACTVSRWIATGSRSVPCQQFMRGYPLIALSAALLLGLVSSAYVPVPRWAYVEWSMMVLLIALGASVAAIRQQFGEKFDRLWISVLLFTATAFILKVIAAYTAAMVERLPLHIWWLLDGFSNPRFFGHFQAMTLPLLVLPAMFWAKTPASRMCLSALPALWWMLAIASGTRGTWLAMMAAFVVLLTCAGRKSHRWIMWQVGAFLTGLVLYGLFFFVIPAAFTVQADTVNRLPDIANLSFRDVLWKQALAYSVAHPILGIGPMHFAYYPNPVAAHPHMSLLQWAAEWGLPSALLVLGVVLHAGIAYVRQLRTIQGGNDETYTVRLALLASLSAAAAQSLVDGVIVMPYSQTLLAVLCGWAFGIYYSNGPLNHHIDYMTRRICSAVVLASAVMLVWGIFPEIPGIVNREGAFNTSVVQEGVLLKPRFWSSGWIYK